MGEALTTKAIAKKIKAAGLQKVRWYCQVCEKQCRDANGYKCHIESEAHQREIAIYQQNPGKFNDEYSRDFEKGFMDIVKRQYKNTRVLANIVYNEYIRDRNHTHLNATRWVTLTGFVMHLGKSGKCKVEESPKGWYISYVETDPEQLAKEEKLKKKLASEQDEETRALQDAEKRSKLAAELAPVSAQPSVATELKQNTETKIAFSFSGKSKNTEDNDKAEEKPTFKREAETESIKKESREPKKKKLSAMEEILREEEKKKERLNRKDWWITEGIIVKIMNKELAEGQYYKQKGLITEVIDKYVAVIEMESGDMLKLDQSQLETVIPLVGGRVKVVNGAYRGAEATLSGVNVDKYTATIKLETGPKTGSSIEIDYEDICKLQQK